MMGGFGSGWAGGWGMGMWFGWIVPVLVIGLIVWAVIAFTRSRSAGTAADSSQRALATLKERYARGELDEETFRRMRKELE